VILNQTCNYDCQRPQNAYNYFTTPFQLLYTDLKLQTPATYYYPKSQLKTPNTYNFTNSPQLCHLKASKTPTITLTTTIISPKCFKDFDYYFYNHYLLAKSFKNFSTLLCMFVSNFFTLLG